MQSREHVDGESAAVMEQAAELLSELGPFSRASIAFGMDRAQMLSVGWRMLRLDSVPVSAVS